MARLTKPSAPTAPPHGTEPRAEGRRDAGGRRPRRAARSLVALALLAAGCGEQPPAAATSTGASATGDPANDTSLGGSSPGGSSSGGAITASAPAAGHAAAGLSGVIELQPGLDVDAASFDCVYLLVRKEPGGPLDYVRKLAAPKFPQAFTITEAHGMRAGAAMSGSYQIIARLDRDGDAAAQLGDVQGMAADLALPGGPPVRIVLNQVLTGSGEAPRAATGAASPHAGLTIPPHAGAATSPHGSAVAPVAGASATAGATAGASAPASAGATAASAEAEPPREAGPRFVGAVSLAPQFAGMDGSGTLFIIVRSATSGGAPLAVIRRPAPHFPDSFDIGPEHVTLQGLDNKLEILQGEVKLYARLSQSGMATASPGDLESAPLILKADGPAVTLVLDKLKQ